MRRHGYRYQRTLARLAEVRGLGFLAGSLVRLRFRPAPADTGVVFVRIDLPGSPRIAATVGNVTGTQRRTSLGRPPYQVELVEHVLAALAGMRIDNCYVELNAAEPPGLDGSAQAFVDALRDAGLRLQTARREIWLAEESITVSRGSATLTLHPGPTDRLRISYLLDYGLASPIGLQRHTHDITPEEFPNGLSDCRTFLLREEAAELQKQGLGARTTWSDLVVFGSRGPIQNRLRFANEPARHKVLDVVGDLALFGRDLRGHVVACRSGHSLNVELVRRLAEEAGVAWEPRLRLAA